DVGGSKTGSPSTATPATPKLTRSTRSSDSVFRDAQLRTTCARKPSGLPRALRGWLETPDRSGSTTRSEVQLGGSQRPRAGVLPKTRPACTAIMLRSTPQQPGHAAGLPDDRRSTERKKAAVPRHGGQHAPAHWHARFTRASTFSRTPPSWPRGSLVCLFSGLNFNPQVAASNPAPA